MALHRALSTAAKPGGRSRRVNLRAVLDAIFYGLRSGCPWRLLPGDFPTWQTVYTYFRTWRLNGRWERIHRYLWELSFSGIFLDKSEIAKSFIYQYFERLPSI